MKTPVTDYLDIVRRDCAEDGGAVADYIPELARVDPERFGIALCTSDGRAYESGDTRHAFTIQSVSKPFVYALALEARGIDDVDAHIGVEPSGDPFNVASVDARTGRPSNPMINIGAITTHSLIGEETHSPDQRFELVRAGLSAFAGRDLEVDEAVFESEIATCFRNLALAYLVRSTDNFTIDAAEVVRSYTRQCAVRVTARDLAVMAMTLGSGGVNPLTGVRVVSERVARRTLSVMSTCGMYDESGDWMTDVGVPAKSGVGGGIIGTVPGQLGVAVFSPRLDGFGNSVRGVRTFRRMSADMELHLMQAPPVSAEVVRTDEIVHWFGAEVHLIRLQGALQFASAERALRSLMEIEAGTTPVVVDLTRVVSINGAAREMLAQAMRDLHAQGHPTTLVDPHGSVLRPGEDGAIEVVARLPRRGARGARRNGTRTARHAGAAAESEE